MPLRLIHLLIAGTRIKTLRSYLSTTDPTALARPDHHAGRGRLRGWSGPPDRPSARRGGAQLPAAWVLAGIAGEQFGLLRRTAVPFGGTALGVCIFITFVGPLLELNQQLLDVSPYTHIHKIPGGEFAAEPIGWLLVLVAAHPARGSPDVATPPPVQARREGERGGRSDASSRAAQ